MFNTVLACPRGRIDLAGAWTAFAAVRRCLQGPVRADESPTKDRELSVT